MEKIACWNVVVMRSSEMHIPDRARANAGHVCNGQNYRGIQSPWQPYRCLFHLILFCPRIHVSSSMVLLQPKCTGGGQIVNGGVKLGEMKIWDEEVVFLSWTLLICAGHNKGLLLKTDCGRIVIYCYIRLNFSLWSFHTAPCLLSRGPFFTSGLLGTSETPLGRCQLQSIY